MSGSSLWSKPASKHLVCHGLNTVLLQDLNLTFCGRVHFGHLFGVSVDWNKWTYVQALRSHPAHGGAPVPTSQAAVRVNEMIYVGENTSPDTGPARGRS